MGVWKRRKKMMVMFADPALHLLPNANASALQRGAERGNDAKCTGGYLRAICMHSRLKEALHNLNAIDHPGIYASLLQECANTKALSKGKLVHARMIQMGFMSDIDLDTKLVIMYAKCENVANARHVFDKMPERDVVCWTAVIAAYARHGHSEEALALFDLMQQTGVQPDQFTFASVLSACANLIALERGKALHEDIIRSRFQSDVFVGSALVDMYVKCGSIEHACQVFDKMPQRNVVSWTAMLAGYAQIRHIDGALKLFEKMPARNVISWNTMVAGYARNGHVDDALRLFQLMPERNVVSWNAVIAGYAQSGHVDEALKLFQKMRARDVVSWNSVIAACAQNGHSNDSLNLLKVMQLTGVKPNLVTFVSVLPACANMAALEHGKEMHEDIIRSGFQSDIFVGNALVDMYAKCGSIRDARKVFDKMPERDVISWNAMILGYAMHGCGKDALRLFELMQHSGTKPNHGTFVGVLSACCHAGLVDDGWQYFNYMSQDFHITPAVEHYCCMVDLLGRAGQLREAYGLINNMPIKPNAAVWGSLLGACRIHNNMELGERVAECLFDSYCENVGNYLPLLSNIFAAAGRWNDVHKVRNLMNDRKLKKMPGKSWIEIDNKVYAFLSGDRSHPQMQKIYAELERLSGLMKESGYMPDMGFALHNVEDEQKEHILCHHSEKLAIAFGLLNTSPDTPIRIVKNLRVCGDCHSATKFISKIVSREIILRDANRFHHFKDGQCSCGDYW